MSDLAVDATGSIQKETAAINRDISAINAKKATWKKP